MCDVGTKNLKSNFASNLVGTHPINMPVELIKKIFDQTSHYFPDSKIGYGFTEPLVYPHLIESLEYARKKELHTSVTTNALTLPHKAKALVDAGLNELFISLDGPEDVHNYIRGHKSSFQRAVKGIESVLDQGLGPEIGVFCVITEWNIGRLKEFVDFFSQFPLKHLGFMHTNFTPQSVADAHNLTFGDTYPATDSNINEINIEAMDMDVLWEEVVAIKNNEYCFPVTFSPNIDSKSDLLDFYYKPEKLMGKRCHDAFNNIMIKSDGSVIPAHGRCYNLTIGNLYNDNLKSIWNSSVISQFRKTLNEVGGLLPACSRCCSGFGK
ncbi:hypothetical protein MB14_16545 [Roseivirga ehrenbergii]|uniref:Radical SAM core domain-containing protein n=2 Tax=Roseivirga ehrenbergii (strain DSM 102268 / JCM 13514 / KCTC 12282 / NCIMB 14502 / KMM 6017) TaxID=279360 RepID=A0A150XN42_ROSEK|nr:hypothetical protein MB14_16545 [Roseivirga ehrenbergii]